MGRIVLIIVVAALLFGAAGSAARVPVETRAEAILELQAAIEDERVAIELLKKEPPRRQTAQARIDRSARRLSGIYEFLSATPGAAAAQKNVGDARTVDWAAAEELTKNNIGTARYYLKVALEKKLDALPIVRTAKPAAAVAQCSDGKDNDGDGITDFELEPGCTSSRDVRESSPFSCDVESRIASGRLALTGSCSGAFSEVELMLLDGVQLNGRYDIMHAPACSAPSPTGFRCTTKDGAQNPKHLIDVKIATTSTNRSQRIQFRFFDSRKRLILRFVVPSSR